jgi:hypothetical protein
MPRGWRVIDASNVVPTRAGALQLRLAIAVPGRYELWLGGSTRGRLTVAVDGRRTGSARGVLDNSGDYLPFGSAALAAGTHVIAISYDDSGMAPGERGQDVEGFPIGPLVLSRTEPADPPVSRIPARDWRRLCGRTLDWIEALAP